MYKVEEFYGKSKELEEYLNKKCEIEHLSISQIMSPVRNNYVIVFYDDDDEIEKKQLLLDYAKENLCEKCLTCASFGYFCGGTKNGCSKWEEDINACERIRRVI